MNDAAAEKKQIKTLDKARHVHHADVLFDSNVIRAHDELAEQRLLALADLLVEKPDRGHIWFSLASLYEMLAPTDAATRIDLLKRFRSLYTRFGDRVRFFGPETFASVVAEWNGTSQLYARADAVDDAVKASIEAGDLVGILKGLRDEWEVEKPRLLKVHAENVAKYSAMYESDPAVRENFEKAVALFGTPNALDLCDDIAKWLIGEFAKRSEKDLEVAKANPAAYPCTWTYSLLARLADSAATLPPGEWNKSFAQYGRLLKRHPNDYVDAYIAATGGACGMIITNDESLIEKLNFLHDVRPPLVRLQAFTVDYALENYNPPNGDKRDRSKPIP